MSPKNGFILSYRTNTNNSNNNRSGAGDSSSNYFVTYIRLIRENHPYIFKSHVFKINFVSAELGSDDETRKEKTLIVDTSTDENKSNGM